MRFGKIMVLPLLLGLAVAACSRPPAWRTTDVSGKLPPLDFTLTDTAGQVCHGGDWRGRIVLLFTGFTRCPGVCPATLARLATVLGEIEGSEENVRVLFVSLDPEHDRGEVLEAYVRRFGPWFVGLTGTPAQLDALARRYFLGYRREKTATGHTVIHSDVIVVFDRRGRARLLARSTTPPDALKADLIRLLEE